MRTIVIPLLPESGVDLPAHASEAAARATRRPTIRPETARKPAVSNPPGDADNPSTKGRRRTGGGGGSSNNPPGSPGETPDDRLDKALDQIRDAQRRRLPEDSPPETSGDGRKDW